MQVAGTVHLSPICLLRLDIKMTISYSPSTKGFYPSTVYYPSLPEDLISITDDQHRILMIQLNQGNKEIAVVNGELQVIDSAPVLITWNDIRAVRDALLTKSDFTQVPDYPNNRAGWATYRQELRDITKTFSDPNSVVWPVAPGA